MKKINKWFAEVFLPSFDARMNNPKYPNSCILSAKQAEVCYKYMNAKNCVSTYNKCFTVYEAETKSAKYLMHTVGRYTFLDKTPK